MHRLFEVESRNFSFQSANYIFSSKVVRHELSVNICGTHVKMGGSGSKPKPWTFGEKEFKELMSKCTSLSQEKEDTDRQLRQLRSETARIKRQNAERLAAVKVLQVLICCECNLGDVLQTVVCVLNAIYNTYNTGRNE